MKQVLPSI